MKHYRLSLLLITLLAGVMRFYQLGQVPQSLNWDEVAIGYNAYSILHTGKDEYGNFLPSSFRSFEDYKSPVYIYATSFSIFLFGKTEFAIRFISALSGTLTVPLLALWTSQILRSKTTSIPLLASMLCAILPWHVHFSRVAFEANLALFFTLLTTTLLLTWINQQKFFLLILSAFTSVLGIYTYASTRLFIPLIILTILILHYRSSLQGAKQLFVVGLFASLLLVPQLNELTHGTGLARYQATSIFYRNDIAQSFHLRLLQIQNPILARTLYNHRLPYFQAYLQNYFSYLQSDFLFFQLQPTRFHVPGEGLVYFWLLPFILFGLLTLVLRRQLFYNKVLFAWFPLSLVPAAFTWDSPHPIRAYLLLPVIIVFSAIGIHASAVHFKPQVFKFKIYIFTVILLISVSTLKLSFNYLTHLNLEFSNQWLWGRKEMISKVQELEPDFQTIKISLNLDWSYIWFLWCTDISPAQYLSEGGTISGAFDSSQNRLGKIQFTNFDYTQESQNQKGTLFVGTPSDFPPNFIPSFVIENSEGQKPIYLVRS